MVNEAIIMPAIAPDNDKLFFFKPCWAIQIGTKIVTVKKWRIYKYLLRFKTIDEKTARVLSCNVKKNKYENVSILWFCVISRKNGIASFTYQWIANRFKQVIPDNLNGVTRLLSNIFVRKYRLLTKVTKFVMIINQTILWTCSILSTYAYALYLYLSGKDHIQNFSSEKYERKITENLNVLFWFLI